MVIELFEDEKADLFLPLTYTRPVGALRMGLFTNAERWAMRMGATVGHDTRSYLRDLFPAAQKPDYKINARLIANDHSVQRILALGIGEQWIEDNVLLAQSNTPAKGSTPGKEVDAFVMLQHLSDLFTANHRVIIEDVEHYTSQRTSVPLHESVTVIGPPSQVFLEEGAKVWAAVLNTTDGPVYIGKDAEIMEGCLVRGPIAIGEHAQIKMGAKLYTGTSIGPYCKVGGEVSNCVFQGYSNKGHDGFLGNSLIGEWCNLGADSNSSNLRNNYAPVKLWSYASEYMEKTNLIFCGLIMGDHSKCGINTMFNTATVVGVSANIFGGGFPPKHIPSFVWGGTDGWQEYDLDKALDTARRMYARRGTALSDKELKMLTEVFRMTARHRAFATQSQSD
jgi:UDP-N-acetylglucosamine diphosphorylase/glucosamine-1-phosphate N-acetyltransferase